MCKQPEATNDKAFKSDEATNEVTNSKTNDDKSKTPTDVYSWTLPPETEKPMRISDHFSSLLFGGSIINTALEFFLLAAPVLAYGHKDQINFSLDVKGSMSFLELSTFFIICAFVRRVYNAYLEACYFAFPKYRTQTPKDHALKAHKDLCGRDMEQLEALHFHDKMTMLSQFALNFGLYFALPGFYPGPLVGGEVEQSLQERFVRLVLNHYLLSFCMYWAHRSLHVVPSLWRHIHSFHHWAKHPLSRNTYEDHWFDNFANAIVGHCFAQILIPLDRPTFYVSRIFRILESLEKHSGISCHLNLAHSLQQWMPFAQMPHHHDWHHEGFKGSNYTFSSLGGVWDCVFGTRKGGRYQANDYAAATRRDKALGNKSKIGNLPGWFHPLSPLVGISALVGLKLNGAL